MHAKETDMPNSERADFFEGHYAEWGGFTAAFEKIAVGLDTTPLFKGLPDDSCQSRHWGYLLKGKVLVRYKDHEETISAGEAYYLPPGHNVLVLEEVEMVEFSPSEEYGLTREAIRRNMA